MKPLKHLLCVLIVIVLTGLPVSEAASPRYPALTALSLTLGGMAAGAPAGALAWGGLAEPLFGCSNDIDCGMGPVVRVFFLGVPAGMALGGAVGAGLAHGAVLHTDPNRFWPIVGGLAGLSAALIVTTPFLHHSPALYLAGLGPVLVADGGGMIVSLHW